MADTSPPAGLLDRAGRVFTLAAQLGRTFESEHERRRERFVIGDPGWQSRWQAVTEFCDVVLGMQDAMVHPPADFEPVAEALVATAHLARQIRDSFKTPYAESLAPYLDFWPDLNSVAASGRRAIQEVNKARRPNDPFAFLDHPAAGKEAEIDTTPALSQPPDHLIESAARAIPEILANVPPGHDRTIELVASQLAKRLQNAKHTLAAAQWAIHEAIRAGRLRAGLVAVELPSVGVPGSSWGGSAHQWHGGGRGTMAIPKGKPAPFDCFKVTTTVASLSAWWDATAGASAHTDISTSTTGFIDRLLSGPGDVELMHRELTLLEAHLRQPIDIEIIDREQREAGHSQTQANRNKLKLIRDFNRRLRKVSGAADRPGEDDERAPASTTQDPPAPKTKRSTERGEGQVKLIAALTKHHQYGEAGCLNQMPIGNNELARLAGVNQATASAFFKAKFQGHAKYRAVCRDAGRLADTLKVLNGEFSPHDLYGRRPPDEDTRDDR
jgi:hypothetical protein